MKTERKGWWTIPKKIAAVVLLALVGTTAVVFAATHLGDFFSGPVNTQTVEGAVKVSTTNSTTATWTDSLSNVAAGDPWYSRFEIGANGYAGPVTILWILQEEVSGVWTDTAYTVITTFTLSGAAGDTIYASGNGAIGDNYDWGSHTTIASSWRIAVSVDKP